MIDAEKLDEKILQELHLELRWMPRVDVRNVAVEAKVEAGIATLFGHVTDPSIRRVAETAALRVLGIWSVSNQIKVCQISIEERLDESHERAKLDTSTSGQKSAD